MHKMEKTPKIITIIGMILEGISVVVLFGFSVVVRKIQDLPGLGSAIEADMTYQEYSDFIDIMNLLGVVLIVMATVYSIFFIVNLVLFTGLMREKYDEAKAKRIYLYQAIWGGINLLSNQITGILYLISGVQGYNGNKDKVNVREGI